MVQQKTAIVSQTVVTSLKNIKFTLIIVCCIISLLLAIPLGVVVYQFGYANGKQQEIMSYTSINKAKKIAVKPKVIVPSKEKLAPEQPNSYALIYTSPAGWQSMIWHPDPNSKGSAILSPDYTSINDPEPQTGLSILIYQFPGQFSDLAHLRPIVEETEDTLVSLSQTVVGGFPAWHATFISTDSDRVVDDYHILKEHDHWVIRIVLPGNSLTAAQAEEQKYNYQIHELLQSIQFKTIQYQ